ncbi:hypothetical protein ACVOZ6_003461 [Escherichia coli]
MIWVMLVLSWLLACGLGVLFTCIFQRKAPGFVLGFAVVAFMWLIAWIIRG